MRYIWTMLLKVQINTFGVSHQWD